MPLRNPRRLDLSQQTPFSKPSSFPQPPQHAPRLYRNIAVTFLAVTIVVIGAVFWMTSVKASVTVHVKQDQAKVDTTVEIAKSPDQGQLQGRVVDVQVDNIQEFTVKPKAPTDAAPVAMVTATTTGKVRITNSYSKAQPLVKNTRLLTADGKLFRIDATVNVPSGQSVDVNAHSDQTGDAYAIPSGTKMTIPGLWIDLQKWITAVSITDFKGQTQQATGGSQGGNIVSAQEIADAQSTLQDSILEQAKKTLVTEANIDPAKVADTCSGQDCWQAVYLVTPVEKKANVTAGQVAATFLAQIKVKVVAVYYPKRDMDLLVRSKLKEGLADGRDLVSLDPKDVTFQLQQADTSKEVARIGISATAMTRLTDQSPGLNKDAVVGLSVNDAKKKLMDIDGVQSVDITLSPAWASKMPTKEKIDFKIE